ncbi:MAG: putative haloacid dehalogenase-like hydrolase family protein [Thermoleophilia bacterium]|nr:putative haloacid dehalogenase-like hydrolase family protein [Thermoleophilia bacterium]
MLLYTTYPTTSGTATASVVLGQAGFGLANSCANRGTYDVQSASCSGGTTAANTLSYPSGVFWDGTYLYVADTNNNRVLVWIGWPTINGDPADFVLGQSAMNLRVAGDAANELDLPLAVAVKDTGANRRIAIASEGSNRVTVFNGTPSTNMSASVVLGQSAMNTGTENQGGATATANSLRSPQGLAYETLANGGALWVADTGNNRVVRYSTQTTNAAADRTLGHALATSSVPLESANRNYFKSQVLSSYSVYGPKLGMTPSGQLMEASFEEATLRIWNTPDTVNEAYNRRWGQANRTDAGAGVPSHTPSATHLKAPGQSWSDGTRLLVADSGQNRVLVWDHMPTSDVDPANAVIGQPNMTTTTGSTALNKTWAPWGVTSDGVDVYVSEYNNSRVSIYRDYWTTLPLVNGPTSDVVLGTTGVAGTDATHLRNPFGLSLFQDQLFLGDRVNYRIAIWNDAQNLVTGAPIDAVVGQSSFTARATGTPGYNNVGVDAKGGGLMWAGSSGAFALDPIPRSGATTAGIVNIGTAGGAYGSGPDQSKVGYGAGLAANAGQVWVASSAFGRLMRWTDPGLTAPVGPPTATVACNGAVTITWTATESTTMTVRWGPTSIGTWGGGWPNSVTDMYGASPRYAGLAHDTTLNVTAAGTYYAMVQLADWTGATGTSAVISFTVPPTCPAPTAMLGDNANAQAGTGRANPSATNAPAITSGTWHTSWLSSAGVDLDTYQSQTWSTPPEQAGAVYHLDNAVTGDTNAASSTAGAWTGTATYTPGKFAQAISTAAGRYVSVANSASISKANDFTVDAWVRAASITGNYPVVVGKSDGGCAAGNNCNYSLEFHRVANQVCGVVVTTANVEVDACAASTALVGSGWHHLAMAVDGSNNLRLYVDGVLADTQVMGAAARTTTGVLRIGNETSGSEPFTGDVDEVRFAPKALDGPALLGYVKTRRPHLQLLHDTGVGGGQGLALGAACSSAARCGDITYAGPLDVLRQGARYWNRMLYNTATNNYWTSWANDWLETDSTSTISISVNPTVNLGTTLSGTDAFGTSTIQVASDDAGGYQLLAHDASNTVALTGTPSGTMPDFQPPAPAPAPWAASAPLGLGFNVRDATGGRLAKWGAVGPFPQTDVTNNLYASLGVADVLLHQRLTYSLATDSIVLTTRLDVPPANPPGSYTGSVTLTVLANP